MVKRTLLALRHKQVHPERLMQWLKKTDLHGPIIVHPIIKHSQPHGSCLPIHTPIGEVMITMRASPLIWVIIIMMSRFVM